ncbi:MAG: TlyA family RNA methyltransferase [Thermodesulfobacteriota bacterium]
MKIRLDRLLAEKGLATSRQQAQALIATGLVRVDGHPAAKTAAMVDSAADIAIVGKACPYVSRGGLKLAAALEHFQIRPAGLICADIGASTGGFTDCLLQNGAARVYAIDVGYGQLAWKLRQDERVTVFERCNARHLQLTDLPSPVDLAVTDASFISLRLLLPAMPGLFGGPIAIVALIKPQFEVGREAVGKGGVVRDEGLHKKVIDELAVFAGTLGLATVGVTPSPLLGPKGNREFLWYLRGEK